MFWKAFLNFYFFNIFFFHNIRILVYKAEKLFIEKNADNQKQRRGIAPNS